MTWLIWWIRNWFCIHSWKLEEKTFLKQKEEYAGNSCGLDKWNIVKHPVEYVSATCQKCGWHRSYKKWNV